MAYPFCPGDFVSNNIHYRMVLCFFINFITLVILFFDLLFSLVMFSYQSNLLADISFIRTLIFLSVWLSRTECTYGVEYVLPQ